MENRKCMECGGTGSVAQAQDSSPSLAIPPPLPRRVCPRCGGLKIEIVDMSDAEVRAAWLRTDGEVGNPMADVIAAEMQRRGIDV